jgi:hypothetical protein
MIASACGLRSTVTYMAHGKEGLLLVDSIAPKSMVFCGVKRSTNPCKTTNELMLQH